MLEAWNFFLLLIEQDVLPREILIFKYSPKLIQYESRASYGWNRSLKPNTYMANVLKNC